MLKSIKKAINMLIKVAAWDLFLYSHQSIWHQLSKRNEVLDSRDSTLLTHKTTATQSSRRSWGNFEEDGEKNRNETGGPNAVGVVATRRCLKLD